MLLGGCASFNGPTTETAFLCDGGASFKVAYRDRQARITTAAGQYVLDRRPSSIGKKFASTKVTFIHDDDRAALNGADGGPFRRCSENVR